MDTKILIFIDLFTILYIFYYCFMFYMIYFFRNDLCLESLTKYSTFIKNTNCLNIFKFKYKYKYKIIDSDSDNNSEIYDDIPFGEP
jgi:hypothetical protein